MSEIEFCICGCSHESHNHGMRVHEMDTGMNPIKCFKCGSETIGRDDFRKDQALHFAPSPNLNKKSLARNEITF